MIDRQRLKSILGGSAGNLVEWYDWYAFSALSLYFAPVFFPKGDSTAQLLNTAGIFAAGFFMRPVGAWVMGRFSDRHGRKTGLAVSVMLMALGSLLIACAPSYASVGILSPALLLLARLIQGFSVGAEYGSSATYLSEMAPRARRGFWASLHYVSLILGQLLSLAVLLLLQATLSEAEIAGWAWRLPFAFGAVLAIAVYLMRRRMEETASFAAVPTAQRGSSMTGLWRDHRREFLLVMAITAGGSLAFYAYTTYLQKFLVNTAGFTKPDATWVMTLALLFLLLLQPVFGALADRFGRRPLLLIFGVGTMAVTVPVFNALAKAGSPALALALIVPTYALLACYTSISALIKAELFPAPVRTLGVALPYALGNSLFGGTAEFVALKFKGAGIEAGFYWYIVAIVGIATVAFAMLPETRQDSLILED